MKKTLKQCGCGKRYTLCGWLRLPFVGIMPDPVEPLELRNCTCGSTIAVDLRQAQAVCHA